MSYDKAYKEIADYFGTEASELLKDHHHQMDKAKPVLDVGAGQGRNSLFMARQGFTIDAVEPSQVGVDIIAKLAGDHNLSIKAYCSGFENFMPKRSHYGAILLFGVIQILSWDMIELLTQKIETWTEPGSLILISAFTTDDPRYNEIIKEMKQVARNSFITTGGDYRTFLEPGELLTLFKDYQPIYHWEGMGPEHSHGGKPPHRHGSVHAIFKR